MPNETEKKKVETMVDMLQPILDYCDKNKIQIALIAGDTEDLFSYVDGTIDFISSLIVVATDSPEIQHIANFAAAKMIFENTLSAEKLAFAPNPETEN
jgi:hypothetical protein